MAWDFKILVTAIVSFIVYTLGGWDAGLEALVYMVILDYVTGILKAVINKNLSSVIGWKGIIKKVGIFVAVMISVQAEKLIGQPNSIHNLVCYAFVTNEGISAVENLGTFIPLPPILKDFFQKLKDKEQGVGKSG